MASTIVAGNITNGGTAISSDSTGILAIKTGTGSGTTALTIDASQYVNMPMPIQPITATVATNALTISTGALFLNFRSTSLGSGAITTVTGTPANLVVPASATLGTVSAVQSRLVVLALNNAGTIELAVVNISGGTQLDETNLISTTAISSGSTSASAVYSNTARTSVAYRVIGYIESTQATAGTWATAPSTIQGEGGQALSSMSSIGYGQTWQLVTRTSGVTYYNTTGKPISVWAYIVGNAATSQYRTDITIAGLSALTLVGGWTGTSIASTPSASTIIIPPGASYVLTDTNLASRVTRELR